MPLPELPVPICADDAVSVVAGRGATAGLHFPRVPCSGLRYSSNSEGPAAVVLNGVEEGWVEEIRVDASLERGLAEAFPLFLQALPNTFF